MKYVWKGPPNAVEVWPETAPVKGPAKPIFSGPVATGRVIDADLPAEHPQIKGWFAFGLIAPAPAEDTPARKSKEPSNG